MWIDRILARLDGDDPGSGLPKLRGFQVILALVIATEYLAKGIRDRALMEPLDWVAVLAAIILAAAVIQGRRRRLAFAGIALLQAWWIWTYFPQTGNHRYLELWFALLLTMLDDREPDERRLLLRSLRWSVVVVLFSTGLQKLVHGYWFRGQFLAWSLWRESFATALAPLMSATELERLISLGADAGEGPYLVRSPAVVVLSNLVWLGEMGLAVLLVPQATRRVAWVGACVLLALTELVARELMFGVEFVAALALFARSGLLRRLVWPAALLLALLILVRLGFLPEVGFH